MSVQEAALYGDLVLALRDHAATQMAVLDSELDADSARARLDEFIRGWFFTPREELYGSTPREVIWREQLGEPNPLPKEYAAEVFGDDCPICRAMREEIESAESDEAHGHHWTYCPDSCLLDRYDPEGSEERWRKDLARMEAAQQESERAQFAAPDYAPPPTPSSQIDPQAFLSALQQPWLDPELHRAGQKLAERCDVPLPPMPGGASYRCLTRNEALSVVAGLHQQGVNIPALLAQIEAWPYENIALDWMSEPERNAALICRAMETEAASEEGAFNRFRHHREFIFALARLAPPGARLWLSGWLEAVVHGAMMAGS